MKEILCLVSGLTVAFKGIGTATALIENKSTVESNKLTVVGVDYDKSYIKAAIENLEKAGLSACTEMHCKSVYDEDLGKVLSSGKVKGKFDAVYFSGSWFLMPSPVEAVRVAGKLLKDDGNIYITQTFQKQQSMIMKVSIKNDNFMITVCLLFLVARSSNRY